jgi:clan AA aspartic protease (TIGR02281 family)
MNRQGKSLAKGLLGIALCWAGASVAVSQTAALPSSANDQGMGSRTDESASVSTVIKAMREADVPTLANMYASTKEPVAHVWSAMALERVHFNLDAATEDAKVCERDLFDSRPHIALLCGEFESGNLRLAGRTKEADDNDAQLIARYHGRVREKALAEIEGYQRDVANTPKLVLEQPAGPTTLVLKTDSPSPVFTAKANDQAFDLTLDTGATDLVLGQDQARKFGVKLRDQALHVSGVLSKGIAAQRGLLDKLQLGDITMRNVPVTVIPRSIALLGANLVAPLGTLKVSRSSLVISGTKQSPSTSTCSDPMLVASDLRGHTLTIVPQLLIDGAPRSVMLDTGAARYLIGSKQALSEVTTLHRSKSAMADIGDNYAFAAVKNAKVNITLAGQPIDMYFDVYSNSDMRWPVTLGAGALRDMDFVFDFRHQHMCFELHPNLH